MITKVKIKRFKRFLNEEFDINPKGITICAGPNGSGKSSLLHALAVWSFGAMTLYQFKGKKALLEGYDGQGVGISKDDFTPVNIPDLRHLWHNLKSQIPGESYPMSISVEWEREGRRKELSISFSLVQDRFYAKATSSNLSEEDELPQIIYLPPVAGIDAREEYATPAKRRALLGRGLAGSVLRNFLLDLEKRNREERNRLQGNKSRLSKSDLSYLRKNDPWERLNSIMREVFGFELRCEPFNSDFHSVIKVNVIPKRKKGNVWRNDGPARDLMVEGAGAQQWLTVFAFALTPDTDVLLLDEPDAHLHSSLKLEMIDRLSEISSSEEGPQILMATHAIEILKRYKLGRILDFGRRRPRYLVNEVQRSKLISGLGDDYDTLIEKARISRFILFVENNMDCLILKTVAEKCGMQWPDNIAVHCTTDNHSDRLKFFRNLLGAIDGLKSLSIRDRDDMSLNNVDPETLRDKSVKISNHYRNLFYARTWRRREIENYALVPSALSRICGDDEARRWWEERGWIWPENNDRVIEEPLLSCDIKDSLFQFIKNHGVKSFVDFFQELNVNEIHSDLKIITRKICEVAGQS